MSEQCNPISVLTEAKVVIEPHSDAYPVGWGKMTEEERAAWMEDWARELWDFFRDHRSQDVNSVRVDRTFERVCNQCRRPWEEMFDESAGEWQCAWCGIPLEVVR